MRAPSLRLAILLTTLTGLAACKHAPEAKAEAKTEPMPAAPDKLGAGLREQQSWLDALPACSAEDVAAATGAVQGARDEQVRVRGHLTTSAAACTKMSCRKCERIACEPGKPCAGGGPSTSRLVCGEPLECCNRCGWEWVVAPAGGGAAVHVQRAGETEPPRGDGLDCVLSHLPSTDVIVSGRLAGTGDLVTGATLCVVRSK